MLHIFHMREGEGRLYATYITKHTIYMKGELKLRLIG